MINEAVDRDAPYQARNLLGHARAMFNWAIEAGDYGIEVSPCDRIRPKHLIGERVPRDRVLTDAEIRAVWNSAERMGYPFGSIIQLLMLTGVRKSEASGARWREMDMLGKVWTVPAERFKSKSTHLVPLTKDAISLLRACPYSTRATTCSVRRLDRGPSPRSPRPRPARPTRWQRKLGA